MAGVNVSAFVGGFGSDFERPSHNFLNRQRDTAKQPVSVQSGTHPDTQRDARPCTVGGTWWYAKGAQGCRQPKKKAVALRIRSSRAGPECFAYKHRGRGR